MGCLVGFDVDHIVRCLAAAIQNKIILSVAKSRPHVAPAERVAACAIFLEPACRERLERVAVQQASVNGTGSRPTTGGSSTLSFCSPLMSKNGSTELKDSMGRRVDPLNSLASRTVPNKWDIYGFLRDVMVNFRLEPEASVVTLVYIMRFIELSRVALTPDNWQRLTIAAMM